jgi:ABC-2 type transport system ATP-binding protein
LQAAVFRLGPADTQARIDELSDLLELRPLLGLPVRELSLGQRVRCDLAAALLHRPRLLLLDEPTIGLDVGVKRRLRAFLRGLADHGVTVLLTTHDLVDVAAVCDRVVLLDAGRVRFDGSVAGLRAAHGAAATLQVEGVGAPPASLSGAEALPDGTWTARVAVDPGASPSAAAAALLGRLHAAGVVPTGLSVEEPDLEAVVAAAQGASGPL